uniref:sodium- and chloride-dependent GABA transporter 2-like n=1 Tax=Ciona intestinalis TaxID=7719 RepID=UPI000EF527FF|nr:sodium- and chloride-dependent GABA transporter 2-like [Ciona intestinalis]|eukprot:XP_009858748.2 sodium- and chloride-dependent GABA transporter 2-like [Ciona intestinalis]
MKQTMVQHEPRQKWAKPFDFLFSTVGYVVGLGNLWRFPYLCFENGGGAFLIPYTLSVIFIAIPVIILETSFGQYCQQGVSKSWNRVPLFKGVGLAGMITIFHSSVYYVIILAWAAKYLVASFQFPLPWTSCGNSWNTESCVEVGRRDVLNVTGNIAYNDPGRNTSLETTAAEEFWSKQVLQSSDGIENIGSILPDLVLYFLLLWVGLYICTFKGIKWSSKIVYVTATLPIVLIIIILVHTSQLDGASNGIYLYLTPNMTKLANPSVWISAATQATFSFGSGRGSMLVMSSFNQYNHNFLRDAVTIGICDTVASFLSGFAVFASLGFMAKQLNTTVLDVAKSGPGLVFIAHPQSISLLPHPQIWSCLFFITLILLGFDSEFVFLEVFVTFIVDCSSRIRSYRWHREVTTAIVCTVMCLIGLSMVTEGGIYVFEIYNNYAVAGWCLFLLATTELIAIAWVYGIDVHFRGMTDMLGPFRGKLYLKLCWKYITPSICLLRRVLPNQMSLTTTENNPEEVILKLCEKNEEP